MAIRASVSVVYADLSYVSIGVSTEAQQVAATYTYALPVASINYIELTADVTVDIVGRYRIVQDVSVVVDAPILEVLKVLSDAASITDSAALSFAKSHADSVGASETSTLDTTKVLRDFILHPADVARLSVALGKFDSASLSDTHSFDIQKALQDGVGMNDLVGVPDGITYSVIKTVSNIVAASESHTIDTAKALADSYILLDTPVIAVDKVLSDSLSTSDDTYAIDTNKVLTDINAITEALAVEFMKAVAQDSFAFIDGIALDVAAAKFDTAVLDDSNAFSLAMLKSDIVTIAENLAYAFARTVAAEQVFVADSQIIYTSKGLQDLVGFGDSGYLLMQDYCDLSYFLEDYVGASRSF